MFVFCDSVHIEDNQSRVLIWTTSRRKGSHFDDDNNNHNKHNHDIVTTIILYNAYLFINLSIYLYRQLALRDVNNNYCSRPITHARPHAQTHKIGLTISSVF